MMKNTSPEDLGRSVFLSLGRTYSLLEQRGIEAERNVS